MQPSHDRLLHELRAARARRNALLTKLAGDRMIAALDRLGEVLRKEYDPDQPQFSAGPHAGYNPDQPRVPAGSPEGGQWTSVDGTGDETAPILLPPIVVSASGGIGHNQGPSLDDPPQIPKQDPGDQKSRLQTAKDVAKWLAMFGARRIPVVAGVMLAIEAAEWLRSELPSIRSYQDDPRTYEELVRGAKEKRAGYEKHHTAEQRAAEKDLFPRSMIDDVDNIVSIPTYKHRQITGWYQQGNPIFGGLSPREYLRGKDWSERIRVGKHALREFKVLKP